MISLYPLLVAALRVSGRASAPTLPLGDLKLTSLPGREDFLSGTFHQTSFPSRAALLKEAPPVWTCLERDEGLGQPQLPYPGPTCISAAVAREQPGTCCRAKKPLGEFCCSHPHVPREKYGLFGRGSLSRHQQSAWSISRNLCA